MDDFRRYPTGNTRQIIDYNRFLSLTGEKVFLCIDRGVMEIARYFLNTRGSWRTSYAVDYGEVGYTIPTQEQFELVQQAIAEGNIDMSNCDEINESLQGIIGAINALGTGTTGSGGCGCIADGGTDVTDFNDNPSEDIPSGGDLPPGFSTQEEYDTYRCSAASWVIDNYIQTLRNWAGLFGTVGGLTLAVITGLLLLTVPPIGLSLILAALGILVGIDIGLLAVLSEIADDMETRKQDYICSIFEATTTQEARDALASAAADSVTNVGPTPEEPFLQICDNLISNEQMEVLFTQTAEIEGYPGDCDECATVQLATLGIFGCIATIIDGSFFPSQETEVEGCVSTVFGTSRANMFIGSTASPTNRHFEIVAVTGDNGGMILNWSSAGIAQTQQDWPQLDDMVGLSWDATELHIIRNTGGDDTVNFTITFVVTEV